MKKLFGVMAIISFILMTAAAEGNAGIGKLFIVAGCTVLFSWLAGAFNKEAEDGVH